MGLDITAYRKIIRIELPEGTEPYNYRAFTACLNGDFPGRADDITDGAVYLKSEEFHFRAGSYSGYGEWRRRLAGLAGYVDPEAVWNGGVATGPFFELINFSDCEGIIGTSVSAKLAKDFADHEHAALGVDGPDSEWFVAKYAEWKKAFEIAADGGCVDFH